MEELRVLLQMPDPRKNLWNDRDIVLLSLLYDSGARAQELCGIRVGDIRFSNPASVLLHGKGGKSRVVPLMNRPTRILQQFIAERKFGTAEKDAPLFLNQRGEPITPACIRNVICKYISRAKNIRPDLFNESSQSSSFAGGWHRISLHSRLFRTCLCPNDRNIRHSKSIHAE